MSVSDLSKASGKQRKAWDATMTAAGARPRGGTKLPKRASGRTIVLSKAMKVVDEETRFQVRDARLDALEADNYAEEAAADGDDDWDFQMEESKEAAGVGAARPKRKATGGGYGSGGGGGFGSGSKKKGAKGGGGGKGSGVRRFRSLDQVIFDLAPAPSARGSTNSSPERDESASESESDSNDDDFGAPGGAQRRAAAAAKAKAAKAARAATRAAAAAAAAAPAAAAKRPTYVTAAAAPSLLPQRHFCSVCGYYGSYTCTRCGMRFCSLACCEHHKETRCLKFSA